MDAELVILPIIGEGIRETVKWYQALLVLQLSQRRCLKYEANFQFDANGDTEGRLGGIEKTIGACGSIEVSPAV